MAGWYFAGPDSESSTDAERNEVSRQINAILSRLGSGWMIQVEAVRLPTTDYPSEEACHFPDSVTRAIDSERRAHFERERGHFESRHALILTWRPPEPRRSGLTRYVYSDTASRSATYADTTLDSSRTSIREVEQYLANVITIRRMVMRETEDRGGFRIARYEELFQFIRFCITGENHPIRLPDIPMYLDWLVTAELQHGLSPKPENRFLGVVAIDGLPAESWPGILNSLDLMPLTYRWSSRFVFLDERKPARNWSVHERSGSRRCAHSSISFSRRRAGRLAVIGFTYSIYQAHRLSWCPISSKSTSSAPPSPLASHSRSNMRPAGLRATLEAGDIGRGRRPVNSFGGQTLGAGSRDVDGGHDVEANLSLPAQVGPNPAHGLGRLRITGGRAAKLADINARIEASTIPGAGVPAEQLNFGYSVSGHARWRPIRVYSDGEKTYIQFYLLIPQGTKLFGRYDSKVSLDRVVPSWSGPTSS